MEIVGFLASVKYLQKTSDSNIIESGYYCLDENIVCLSCQIGCPMNCLFCHSGYPIGFPKAKSFVRNLSSIEIVEQARNAVFLDSQNFFRFEKAFVFFCWNWRTFFELFECC